MKPKAQRTNISLTPAIRAMADQIMSLRAFSDLSGFLSQLVREEWERRHGPIMMPQQSPAADPSNDRVVSEDRPTPSSSDVVRERLRRVPRPPQSKGAK